MLKGVCNIILEENQIFAFNCHIPDDYEETYISLVLSRFSLTNQITRILIELIHES